MRTVHRQDSGRRFGKLFLACIIKKMLVTSTSDLQISQLPTMLHRDVADLCRPSFAVAVSTGTYADPLNAPQAKRKIHSTTRADAPVCII